MKLNIMIQKMISSCLLLVCLFISCNSHETNGDIKKYDVCVYGGTASGVIAAYSAKKMGKSVVIIEPGKYLGGMTTGGLGATDIGNKFAITGLARKFYRDLGRYYGKFEQWRFAPSAAFKLMDQYVKDANIDVIYYRRIVEANVVNTVIKSIALEDSRYPDEGELLQIEAKQYIDCSYEGDLMAKSGVSYFIGREDNGKYDETLNGSQMSIWHQFPDGVDPYRVEGDPKSGLCWGIQNQKLNEIGKGDQLIQAYNFRLCLSDDKNNSRPFVKPDNYDPDKYELLARAMKKMDSNIANYLLIKDVGVNEGKYDVNNKGPLSTDMIGMNYDYPDGNYETRERIWQEHVDYTKGLMYFLTHDERVPIELRNEVLKYGWAKDEFVDNGNFPTQLYIREARRMNGEYIMTQKNCMGEESVGDAIGMAAYGMDSHNCQRVVVNGMVKNEGDVEYHGFQPYFISYKSITPKREECSNLLVPVCVSSSHIAYGSIRMEPVFMVLGQSAGVAATLAIDQKCRVQEIDVTKLRNILKDNPYLDGSIAEILVDDADIDKISRSGGWSKQIGAHYKNSFLWSPNTGGSSHLSFKPVVKEASVYEVYFYCTNISDDSMPGKMVFEIQCKDGKKMAEIDPKLSKTSWVSLGKYSFEKGFGNSIIKILGDASTGPIFADAILLVPVESDK